MQINKRVNTFDDWMDYLREWQKDIGLAIPEADKFIMTQIYDDKVHPEIEFGDFKGNQKWERVSQIPTQNMRDALLALTYVQGDTFPAGDGCNTCTCGFDGTVGCTKIACPPKP